MALVGISKLMKCSGYHLASVPALPNIHFLIPNLMWEFTGCKNRGRPGKYISCINSLSSTFSSKFSPFVNTQHSSVGQTLQINTLYCHCLPR